MEKIKQNSAVHLPFAMRAEIKGKQPIPVTKEQAIEKTKNAIIEECKGIATGVHTSLYRMVSLTNELSDIENGQWDEFFKSPQDKNKK